MSTDPQGNPRVEAGPHTGLTLDDVLTELAAYGRAYVMVTPDGFIMLGRGDVEALNIGPIPVE